MTTTNISQMTPAGITLLGTELIEIDNGASLSSPINKINITTLTNAGDAAAKNTGTTAGTVAAGNDSRIVGAVQSSTLGQTSGVATLDGSGKLTSSQIPSSLIGAVVYQGVWNANTNSPTLASGVGTKGFYYRVSVAGATTIDGISSWAVGDTIIFDGTVWSQIEGQAAVESVNGKTGPSVSLTASDVSALPTSTYTAKGDILAGTGSGTSAVLGLSGTNGNVLTEDSAQTKGFKWAPAAAGAAYDYTSHVQTRNGISAAATLTGSDMNKVHTCSGTSADYTVKLPTTGITAGDIVSFVMDAALTKLVTIDAQANKINNVATRVMWANESCTLQYDGANWTKIAGLTIPMVCVMTASSTQSVTDSAPTAVLIDTATIDVGLMAKTASNKMTTRRGGNYRVGFSVGYVVGITDMPIIKNYVAINSVNYPAEGSIKSITANDVADIGMSRVINIAAAKDIVFNTYQQSTGAGAKQTGTNQTFLSAEEIISW